MVRGLQVFLTLIGRFFISLVFIVSAINKMVNWQDTKRALVTLIGDWHTYVTPHVGLQKMFASLLPFTGYIIVIAILLELIGGLFVFFGFKVRLGAFLLVLFSLPATLFFHHFWFLDGTRRELETIFFLKNLAIIGGLFHIWVFGKIKKKSPPKFMPEIIKEDDLPTIPKH